MSALTRTRSEPCERLQPAGTTQPSPGGTSHLQQDEELKDSSEGGREEPGVGDSHLEEKGVEEAVTHIDERVLVDVGVPDPVGPNVVVQRNVVVVGLVLRHDGGRCRTLLLPNPFLGQHGSGLLHEGDSDSVPAKPTRNLDPPGRFKHNAVND